MAAPARPPGISDGRVPCPVCGGLIHPVAGRCKHCKQDLSQYRAGRPAAAATLPALQQAGKSGPVPQPIPNTPTGPSGATGPATSGSNGTHTNGYAPPAAVPQPISVAALAAEPSQPILPPRTTMTGIPKQGGPSVWRSWPTMVIIIAMLAIGTAVVLMMWPKGKDKPKHALEPPPAPERMDTDPLAPAAPPSGADPWGGGGGHTQVLPPQAPPLAPDTVDPYAAPSDPYNQPSPYAPSVASFKELAMSRMCQRLVTCLDRNQMSLDDPSLLTDSCALWNQPAGAQTSCAVGRRCLERIDAFDCSKGSASILSVLLTIDDCTDAINNC
jgi:hypothetical protein